MSHRPLAAGVIALALVTAGAAKAECYVPSPAATPDVPVKAEDIGGRPVLRYVPAHPKGIIFFFHGTGGSEKFAVRLHSKRVLGPLVAAGFGYVSAPSLDRTDPVRWKVDSADPATNPDLAYLLALHKALIAKGEIAASTPVFTLGMSNGGSMANLFASVAKKEGLPVRAVADYMGPFPAAMRPLVADPKALPPTFLVLSQNDGLVSSKQVGAIADGLVQGGARIERRLNTEKQVCAASFAEIPGLTAADRETLVHKTLPDLGMIDADGNRTLFRDHLVISRDDIAAMIAKTKDVKAGRDVANELLIAWAGHQMRSDYAADNVAFFQSALAK